MKTAISKPGQTHASTVTRRPFLRLEPEPRAALTEDVCEALAVADDILSDQVPALVKGLVNYAIGFHIRRRATGRRVAPSVSAINRRRRASTQWIQAILAGRIDRESLHAIGHSWIPQLAGTGPDLHQSATLGRQCVEYLRGAITARVFERPAENLVPWAKAMWGIETVLAIHLDAFEEAVAQSRSASPGS